MLAQEFINHLTYLLSALPQVEKDRVLSYYCESISDRMENGENESDIIASFGDIDQLARSILIENGVYMQAPQKTRSIGATIGLIILFIFASPFLIGIGAAIFGVLVAVFATLFSLVIAFFAVTFAFALSGIVLFFTSFVTLFTVPTAGIFQMGTGLLLAGLSIFMSFACYYFSKAVIKLLQKTYHSIKNAINKRKKTA